MKNENLTKQQIIDRLGQYRTQKKLSAYDLGTKLGHAKTYIYRIESGEIKLTLDSFLEILEVMDISTHDFFCFNSPLDQKLFNAFQGLSAENKELVLTLAEKLKN